jgi:hypothetical protein
MMQRKFQHALTAEVGEWRERQLGAEVQEALAPVLPRVLVLVYLRVVVPKTRGQRRAGRAISSSPPRANNPALHKRTLTGRPCRRRYPLNDMAGNGELDQKCIFFDGPKVHVFRRTKSACFSPDQKCIAYFSPDQKCMLFVINSPDQKCIFFAGPEVHQGAPYFLF